MKRSDQKPYRLSARAWRTLRDIGLRQSTGHVATVTSGDAKSLVERGLVDFRVPASHGLKYRRVELTELGQRVYSRLSQGPFCACCGKPIAFVRRVNVTEGKDECEPCWRLAQRAGSLSGGGASA